jgi:predicted amidohydrolase
MTPFRLALAQLPFPESPEASVADAERAIAAAADAGAALVCFPECFVPGYRLVGRTVPPPDRAFLADAHARVAAAAGRAGVAVILGTERFEGDSLHITALVIDAHGTVLGAQDKVQLYPPEEAVYSAGQGRQVFQVGPLKFGVVICHEGFRYPETVRAAARAGAQVVFHPHVHETDPGEVIPTTFADVRASFHEKASLCRAAENTVFYATVNCASPTAATTAAVIRPNGTVLAHQPHGEPGLLVVDIDVDEATGFLAGRLRS